RLRDSADGEPGLAADALEGRVAASAVSMLNGVNPCARSCRSASSFVTAATRPSTRLPSMRAARYANSAIALVLRHPKQLVERRHAACNLAQSVLIQGQHAGASRDIMQSGRIGPIKHGLMGCAVHRKQLMYRCPSAVARTLARRTAPGRMDTALPRRQEA